MPIPHKIEQAKDSHIWHFKFRPYVPGTYKIHLVHNGLSLISKNIHFIKHLIPFPHH